MSKFNAYQLRKWSVLVRWRDKTCQLCGARKDAKLQAHHIFSKSYFPELAYDLENGITLCSVGNACHSRFHNMFMQGTRRKCDRKDWDRFLEVVGWSRAMVQS